MVINDKKIGFNMKEVHLELCILMTVMCTSVSSATDIEIQRMVPSLCTAHGFKLLLESFKLLWDYVPFKFLWE